jgi:hypothetical protein
MKLFLLNIMALLLTRSIVMCPSAEAAMEMTTTKAPLTSQVSVSQDLPLLQQTDVITLEELNRRIQNEVIDEEQVVARDLALLWQAAVERNSTIRFAIEKLSRRDATGKSTADPWTKKLLGSLVNLGGVAGSVLTQSPVGILGSGVVQEAMADGPPDPSRLPVTDADMVILAKSLDHLQTQLFETYLTYVREKRLLKLSQDADRDMKQQLTRSDSIAAETLMDITHQDMLRHQQAYASARTALTLITGPEAVLALEQPAAEKS